MGGMGGMGRGHKLGDGEGETSWEMGRRQGQAEGGFAFCPGESHWLGPTSSLALSLCPSGSRQGRERRGRGGSRPRAEQPSGSGMPGIQVTRGCERLRD